MKRGERVEEFIRVLFVIILFMVLISTCWLYCCISHDKITAKKRLKKKLKKREERLPMYLQLEGEIGPYVIKDKNNKCFICETEKERFLVIYKKSGIKDIISLQSN